MAVVAWLTGLPAAGKTSLALATQRELERRGAEVLRLDGDELRAEPGSVLGFGREARRESARRATRRAQEAFADVVIVALVSPYAQDRDAARRAIETTARFEEVFVDTPLAECRARDPKGLYAAAAAGRLANLTGWDDPYERPARPELHLVHPFTLEEGAARLVELLHLGA